MSLHSVTLISYIIFFLAFQSPTHPKLLSCTKAGGLCFACYTLHPDVFGNSAFGNSTCVSCLATALVFRDWQQHFLATALVFRDWQQHFLATALVFCDWQQHLCFGIGNSIIWQQHLCFVIGNSICTLTCLATAFFGNSTCVSWLATALAPWHVWQQYFLATALVFRDWQQHLHPDMFGNSIFWQQHLCFVFGNGTCTLTWLATALFGNSTCTLTCLATAFFGNSTCVSCLATALEPWRDWQQHYLATALVFCDWQQHLHPDVIGNSIIWQQHLHPDMFGNSTIWQQHLCFVFGNGTCTLTWLATALFGNSTCTLTCLATAFPPVRMPASQYHVGRDMDLQRAFARLANVTVRSCHAPWIVGHIYILGFRV